MKKKMIRLGALRSWLLLLLFGIAGLAFVAGRMLDAGSIPSVYLSLLAAESGAVKDPGAVKEPEKAFPRITAHPYTAGLAFYPAGMIRPSWKTAGFPDLPGTLARALFSAWFQNRVVVPEGTGGRRLLAVPAGYTGVVVVLLPAVDAAALPARLGAALEGVFRRSLSDGPVLVLTGLTLGVILLAGLLLPVVWLRQPLERMAAAIRSGGNAVPRRMRPFAAAVSEFGGGVHSPAAETAGDSEPLLDRLLPLQRGFDYPGFNAAGFVVKKLRERKDCFDIFPLGDGRYAIYSGQVSGRGEETTLMTVRLASVVRAYCRSFENPGQVIYEVNRYFYHEADSTALNLFLGFYDPEKKELLFSQAGGLALYHFRTGEQRMQTYHQDILPAGLMDPELYREQLGYSRLEPATGDIVGLFSDGMLKLDAEKWQKSAEKIFLAEGPLGEKVLAYQQQVNGMADDGHVDDLMGLFLEI